MNTWRQVSKSSGRSRDFVDNTLVASSTRSQGHPLPSIALRARLEPLLRDAEVLDDAYLSLAPANPGGIQDLEALNDTLGLPLVQTSWVWPGSTTAQALQQLAEAIRFRNQIAHGIHPRPAVPQQYSSRLPGFFRSLGRATDQAVRDHLVNVIGLVNPWPP
jgi:hypothetical protein